MSENKKSHSIIMEQCSKINMSGVKEVKGFDEETVILDTEEGLLTIKGENMLINDFSATSGELTMEGKVYALAYAPDSKNKSIIKRLLK